MSEISQTERVSDEELDQMIWKLERDGMTPKMLSLMRELREVRRAKGEPVAYIFKNPAGKLFWALTDESNKRQNDVVPLYTAPPAPVVPGTLPCPVFLEPGLKFGKGVRTQCMLDALNRRADYYAELDAMTPEQRAEHDAGIAEFKAMLSPGNSEQLEPVSNRDELPTNSFTNEELAGMAHGDNPQANAYRELLSRRLNSPATPDGWQLVPVEPTHEMRDAYHNAQEEYESVDGLWSPDHQWKAMITAAPKEVG